MSKNVFAKMSNEELCAIIFNLKSQLVEARFKMSSGELSKVNVFSQIRKSIACIFTELTNRGYNATICMNDVILYDIKNTKNKPVVIKNKKIKEIIANQQSHAMKKNAKKTVVDSQKKVVDPKIMVKPIVETKISEKINKEVKK